MSLLIGRRSQERVHIGFKKDCSADTNHSLIYTHQKSSILFELWIVTICDNPSCRNIFDRPQFCYLTTSGRPLAGCLEEVEQHYR